jgi:hypothetical protein
MRSTTVTVLVLAATMGGCARDRGEPLMWMYAASIENGSSTAVRARANWATPHTREQKVLDVAPGTAEEVRIWDASDGSVPLVRVETPSGAACFELTTRCASAAELGQRTTRVVVTEREIRRIHPE